MRALSVLLLITLLGAPTWAGDPPPADAKLRAQIEGWLEDLRSESYATRRAARAQLEMHARRAPDLLEARVDDPDAEVRRTVRELLGPEWKPKVAPVAQADLGALGQVVVAPGTTSLREAIEAIGVPHGARFDLPQDHPDTLRVSKALRGPFFEVLASLGDQAGLWQPRPFDATGTAKLVPVEPGRPVAPKAAAGPLAMRVVEVSATRVLTSKALPRYALELELRWAPSVQLTQLMSPQLVSAEDPAGCAFAATAGRATTTYGVGYTQTARTVTLGIRPEDPACAERIAKLVVDLPGLRMRTGRRSVRFDDLTRLPAAQDGDGRPAKIGAEGSIELRSIKKEGEGRQAQYVMELVGLLSSSVAQSSAQVYVTWSDGREQRLHVMGGRSLSADRTLNLTVRAWPRGDVKPAAVQVRWFEHEQGGALRFTLRDIPLR